MIILAASCPADRASPYLQLLQSFHPVFCNALATEEALEASVWAEPSIHTDSWTSYCSIKRSFSCQGQCSFSLITNTEKVILLLIYTSKLHLFFWLLKREVISFLWKLSVFLLLVFTANNSSPGTPADTTQFLFIVLKINPSISWFFIWPMVYFKILY